MRELLCYLLNHFNRLDIDCVTGVNDATLGLHTWSDPRRVGPYNPRAWVWKDGRIDHRTGFRLEECLSARTIQISDVADIAAFVRQLIGS